MNILRGSVLSLLLLAASVPALGCTILPLKPQQKLEINSIAVLAYPIGISTNPSNAIENDFAGEFTQTIQWQVLVSWKGKYLPGDVIITMTQHETNRCGDEAQYKREVMLLFLDGREPLMRVMRYRPVDSIEDLKFLSKIRAGG